MPLDPPALYIDHLDTVPGSVTFADASGGHIKIRFKIAVFMASEPDLEAHPNAAPAGAAVTVGDVGVAIELAMAGAVLTIVSAASDASELPAPPPVQAPSRPPSSVRCRRSTDRCCLTRRR